jgi:hypothetical protein
MKNVGIIYDYLEYFMAFWYSLWSFGIVFLIWYVRMKKNLATLVTQETVQSNLISA